MLSKQLKYEIHLLSYDLIEETGVTKIHVEFSAVVILVTSFGIVSFFCLFHRLSLHMKWSKQLLI